MPKLSSFFLKKITTNFDVENSEFQIINLSTLCKSRWDKFYFKTLLEFVREFGSLLTCFFFFIVKFLFPNFLYLPDYTFLLHYLKVIFQKEWRELFVCQLILNSPSITLQTQDTHRITKNSLFETAAFFSFSFSRR